MYWSHLHEMLFAVEYYGLLVDALFCLVDKPLEMILGDACEKKKNKH